MDIVPLACKDVRREGVDIVPLACKDGIAVTQYTLHYGLNMTNDNDAFSPSISLVHVERFLKSLSEYKVLY